MSHSRRWFKHFGDASHGNTISNWYAMKDYKSIAFWWWLNEYFCRHLRPSEDGGLEPRLIISYATIRQELGWNAPTMLQLCSNFENQTTLRFEHVSDKFMKVFHPKFVEYNSSWGGKRAPRSDQDFTKKAVEYRSKNKEERIMCIEEDAPVKGSFNLEEAYLKYPLKKGKHRGMKLFQKQIKTQSDFDDLLRAIDVYKQSSTVKKGFIKLWSTFAGDWRDCLEPDYDQQMSSDSLRQKKEYTLEDLKNGTYT